MSMHITTNNNARKLSEKQKAQKNAFWAMALSAPNILTYARILAVPALVACFFIEANWGRWIALLVFFLACVTDFFDGYLARALEQQSSLGRMLDPIADKLLVAASLVMLSADQTISGWSLWAAIIILSREILVSGLREFLAELSVSVPVTWVAKWKTAVQMVALGFLLAGPAADKIFSWTSGIGLVLLWIAALLTLYTGYDYFRAGLRHMIYIDEKKTLGFCDRHMKLIYFAWLREKLGTQQEDVALPVEVLTISDLIDWLISRGPEYQEAFQRRSVIQAAIDHEHSSHDAPIEGASEIAFFPPVTGG